MTPPAATEREDAREAIARIPWYHTLELPGGLATAGWVDCRKVVDRVLLPADMSGMRALDVGTWDGFWAFEMERRGADVVTVDIPDPAQWDWPPRMYVGDGDTTRRSEIASTNLGEGYRLAHELLGSGVVQEQVSVYDLDPERLGTFDIVVVGSILLHLRDPVAALASIRPLARGPVVLNEAIELIPSLVSPRTARARLEGDTAVRWWQPNLAAVEQMAGSAGLVVRRRSRPYFVPLGAGHPPRPSRRRQLQSGLQPEGREHLVAWWIGIPHVSLLADASPGP